MFIINRETNSIWANNLTEELFLFKRQIIQRNNILGYNLSLLRELFHKAFKMDWKYFSCLKVAERQDYYRPVREAVGLRNLQLEDFKWLPNYLSTAQRDVVLEISGLQQFLYTGLILSGQCLPFDDIMNLNAHFRVKTT